MEEVLTNGLIVIIGPRCTGRSTLARSIWKTSKIEQAFVHDPLVNNISSTVYDGATLLDKKSLIAKLEDDSKEQLCLIIDNPITHAVDDRILNLRKKPALIIYVAQYVFDIPFAMRSAIDWWIVSDHAQDQVKRLQLNGLNMEIFGKDGFVAIQKSPLKTHHFSTK